MKKNDFIVASINNPDFNAADFKNIGNMTLENTQMLSEDQYLKSNFIKENPLFQDDNGNFSKEKFSNFYRQKLKEFGEFSTESALDNYQYSLFDSFRKGPSKIRPFGMTFEKVANSERKSTGIVGPNLGGERTFSDRELAQRERIFDYNKGEFTDYTPNDLALTKNPFKWIGSFFNDPLVLATYDDNGTHFDPILGREVSHYKGQKKLNENGVPYYETLAGRSAASKDILSFTDNLTIDGSWINKYDFFDSDGLDKSVAGTIAKNLAVVAPIFIPGAGQYYAGALVVREMAKVMPMLYGMAGLFDNDLPQSSVMNTISAIGNKFSGNTSDYAKEKMFSFENFGNLISDVALQWQQQQFIIQNLSKINKATKATEETAKAKALAEYTKQAQDLMTKGERGEIAMTRVQELTGAAKREDLANLIAGDSWMGTMYGGAAIEKYITPIKDIIAKKTRLAQDLSLGYMAIISNGDVYQDALDHGASKREAAILALGSTVGMFSVDKFLGLGEMFYDPAQKAERLAYRDAVLKETQKITEQLGTIAPITVEAGDKAVKDEAKGLGRYFLKGIQAGKDAVKNYRGAIKEGTLGFFGKAAGEGLEEVSEEFVTDIVKQLGEIAGEFGIGTTNDLGAWKNMKDRYLMSFLGGAIGGGIFSLKDGNFKNRQAAGELLLLLRQGKGQQVRDELKRLHDAGELGSTQLSYKTADTIGEDGKVESVFLTADEENQSQNDYAYNILTQSIEQIETILQKNHLNKSENELFENLVLQDENYVALKDYLEDKSYITGYQRRYQQLVKNIVAQEQKINELSKTDGSSSVNKLELEKAREDLNNMLLERDKFFNGDYSLEYTQKMLFAINPQLAGAFMPITKSQFTRAYFHTSYDFLDGGMKQFVDKAYEKFVKDPDKMEEELDKSFNKFKELQPNMEKILSKQEGGSKEWENIRNTITKEGILKEEDMYTYDSLLPGEDEESESFVNRNTQLEGESPLDFTKRRQEREASVAELNARNKITRLQKILEDAKTFSYGPDGLAKPSSFIDPSTKRYLLSYLGETQKQIKSRLISRLLGTSLNKSLLENAENYGELVNKVRDFLNKKYNEEAREYFTSQIGFGSPLTLYDDLGLNREFTLQDVINSLKSYDLEANTESLSMYTEGANKLDILLDMQKYESLQEQLNTETDPDKKSEIEEQILELLNKKYEAWDQEAFDNFKNTKIEEEFKVLEPKLKNLSDVFNNDSTLRIAKDLEEQISVTDNPALELVKALAPNIGSAAVEVEKALESIHKQFQEEERNTDFILSGDQMKYLEEAKWLIGITRAMVAASSRPSTLQDGMTYNKAVNKFYNDHKAKQSGSEFFKNFEPLYEMDEKIGGQLIMALDGYIDEINSWMDLSKKNQANSIRSLQRASDRLKEARLNFLADSMSSNEFLKDSIVERENTYALFHFEKQFHDNVQKALKEGRPLKDILQSLLAHIAQDKEVLSGVTSNIDEDLKELTPYDKFMYLVSLIGIDPQKQLEAERDFIKDNEKIAPIATQQPAMQLGKALAADPKVINTALEVLQELAKKYDYNVPVMWNTEVITGLGGGGKTSVEAKYLINQDEDTWIAGPTSHQVEALATIAPKAKTFSVNDLIKAIYTGEVKGSEGIGLDKGWKPAIFSGDETKFVIKDAPKHLLIDEATHIDTLKLQVIANWAKKAGVRLTILGDENQNGAPYNLNREAIIAYRTPRLNFSIRNESIWKVQNQNRLVSLLDKARNSDSTVTKAVLGSIHETLKNKLQFSYYENENTIEGEKVVSTIKAEDLQKLSGNVAYIGDNEERKNFIQNNLPSGTTFTALDKKAVQGAEFDYIIVDSDWNRLLNSGVDGKPKYLDGIDQTVELLRDIYTMISRSRKGSIVIDNKLSTIVNNVQEEYTTKYEKLSEENIKMFRDERLQYIEDLLASIKPEEIVVEPSKPTTEEPTKKEEPIKKEEPTEEPAKKEEPEETPPVKNVSDVEKDKVQTEEVKDFEKLTTGYRAYGNVQFKGNITSDDRNRWIPKGGPIRDLGLFRPNADGFLATNTEERRHLVRDLNFIKSLFLYDLDIDLYDLPESLRTVVTKKQLKDATFHLVAEDKGEEHDLIGLTTLDDTKQDFIPGKVISIQARFNTVDGPAILTLGAVADPKTWLKGIENAPISDEEKTKQKAQVKDYEEKLKNLVTEDQEIRINKPKFSGRTELIPLKVKDTKWFKEALAAGKITEAEGEARRKIRLEDLWDSTSEFDARTGNAVISPIYILTKEIPGVDTSLVGRAVMFVSNNGTLSPDNLGTLYLQQKQERAEGQESAAQVRMLVLDNAGVSFHSLYRGGFKDIYTTNRKDSDYTFPFDILPTSIRMLSSMWNFRADLIRFINAMNNSGYTREQLIDMAKTDTKLYQQLQDQKVEEYRTMYGTDPEREPIISSAEYKQWLKNSSNREEADKVLKLIEFNESLDIPRFRVGWSDRTGSYIKKITGLKEGNPYYKDRENYDPNDINGIFINPDLADQYNDLLKDLFDNVITRIFKLDGVNKEDRINYKDSEAWVNNAKAQNIIIDGRTIKLPDQKTVKALPLILIKIAQYMHYKMHYGADAFNKMYETLPKDDTSKNSLHIYLDLDDKENTEIDYRNLDRHFSAVIDGKTVTGLIQESSSKTPIIGQDTFTYEDDDETVYQDCRFDNFFNLIFHGVAFENHYNEFEDGQQVATDALFKYGFFIDPILVKTGGTAEDTFTLCANNRTLFKVNAIPGNPILEFTFDTVTDENPEEEEGPKEEAPIFTEIRKFGIDLNSSNFDGYTDDQILQVIQEEVKDINTKIFNTPNPDFSTIVAEVHIDKVLTITDKWPEVKDLSEIIPAGDGISYTVTNKKGKTYKISNIDGEISVIAQTKSGEIKTDESEEVITSFKRSDISKAIKDFIKEKEGFEDSTVLEEWLEESDTEYDLPSLRAVKTNLENILKEEDVLDESDITMITNIIDEFIDKMNTSDCVR